LLGCPQGHFRRGDRFLAKHTPGRRAQHFQHFSQAPGLSQHFSQALALERK